MFFEHNCIHKWYKDLDFDRFTYTAKFDYFDTEPVCYAISICFIICVGDDFTVFKWGPNLKPVPHPEPKSLYDEFPNVNSLVDSILESGINIYTVCIAYPDVDTFADR